MESRLATGLGSVETSKRKLQSAFASTDILDIDDDAPLNVDSPRTEGVASGFHIVPLLIAALAGGERDQGQEGPRSSTKRRPPDSIPGKIREMSHNIVRSTGEVGYTPALGRTIDSQPLLLKPRRLTTEDIPSPRQPLLLPLSLPSPHRIDFSPSSMPSSASDSSPRPSDDLRCLSEGAVEVILDFLPAAQALSMVARSRPAAGRRAKCARYALSRLDKLASGLAAAEDSFQQSKAREAEEGGQDDDVEETSDKQQMVVTKGKEESENYHPSESLPEVRKRRSKLFPQLGDFASFDLIYKRALLVAHADTGDGIFFSGEDHNGNDDHDHTRAIGAARWNARTLSGGIVSNANRSRDRVGSGTFWKTSIGSSEASRAWSAAHRLMDLLASGMAASMERWTDEDEEKGNFELGIVTDCLHAATTAKREFQFWDSLDLCGLLGLDHFPLVVVPGVCVLHVESPILVCLPGKDKSLVRLMPTSSMTTNGENSGSTSDGEATSDQKEESRPSASIAQIYRAPSGRYSAILVRFDVPNENNFTGEKGHTAVATTEARQEIFRLSHGLGPCRSLFCRSWGVPSSTLVIFRDSTGSCFRNPAIVRDHNGSWDFADFEDWTRVYKEWRKLLGV